MWVVAIFWFVTTVDMSDNRHVSRKKERIFEMTVVPYCLFEHVFAHCPRPIVTSILGGLDMNKCVKW